MRKEAIVVELPLLPELEDELSFAPAGNLRFLVTEYGRPFSENGLGNKMRQWCDEAGLPGCSAHGVRNAGATVAAENGATHEQLKAIYGWTTYQPRSLHPQGTPPDSGVVCPDASGIRSKRERKCLTFGGGGRGWDKKVQKNQLNQRQRKPMVGSEGLPPRKASVRGRHALFERSGYDAKDGI
ncbi:hypothetical protein [Mesorhizobium sp. M7A.F.Ca.US.002.01.1.1]|uniref:hypothetical protein n=1 Tax=Mesorhizobium sp. M7A.F.Ca.US.002.01.1.1 TaxID=2496700 RepID=UPI0013E29051|nr:hypothetical protein [Mesorhizobium sp. M7A.F.Ca.US.002.01.1.1]